MKLWRELHKKQKMSKGANNTLKNWFIGANYSPNNLVNGANYDMIHLSNDWRFIYGTNRSAKIDRLE